MHIDFSPSLLKVAVSEAPLCEVPYVSSYVLISGEDIGSVGCVCVCVCVCVCDSGIKFLACTILQDWNPIPAL